MNKTFFTTVLVLVITQVSLGQEKNLTAQQIADYQNSLMIKELKLNEDQQKTVAEINLRYAKQQKTLIEKEGSMLGKIGDMKKIKKAKNEELINVLTEEQFEKYEDDLESQIRKYMRKNMKM